MGHGSVSVGSGSVKVKGKRKLTGTQLLDQVWRHLKATNSWDITPITMKSYPLISGTAIPQFSDSHNGKASLLSLIANG